MGAVDVVDVVVVAVVLGADEDGVEAEVVLAGAVIVDVDVAVVAIVDVAVVAAIVVPDTVGV